MTPGPTPLPTPLRALRGRSHHAKRADEPRPAANEPTMPGYLLPEAKDLWRDLAPELVRLGVLTVVDGAAFGTCCQLFARVGRYEAIVAEKGSTVVANSGFEVIRPEALLLEKCQKLFLAYASRFGLTASDRRRMSVVIAPEKKRSGLLDTHKLARSS